MLSHKQLFLLNTAQTSDFPRLLEIEKAEGVYIYDTSGKKYLDLVSGFAVSNLGHRHKKVIEAINTHGLVLTPNGYRYPSSQESKGMDRVSEVTERVLYTPQVQDKDSTVQEEDKNKKRGTQLELQEFCKSNGLFPRDADYLWNRWESNGWQNANKPIKDWRATVRSWKAQGYLPSQKQALPTDVWPEPKSEEPDIDLMALMLENRAKAAAKEAEFEEAPPSTEDSTWS